MIFTYNLRFCAVRKHVVLISFTIKKRFYMDLSDFSLLYPSGYDSRNDHPDISAETVEQLELDILFDLKNASLEDFFTSSPEVIKYRQDIFDDMVEYPEVAETLTKVVPVLLDISEVRRLESGLSAAGTTDTRSYLFSLTEIELYTS